MSGISQVDKLLKEKVLDLCWSYLHENFHKFNEANKIKVSMALCTKNIPQKLEGAFQVTQMPAITKDGKPLEFDVGSPQAT